MSRRWWIVIAAVIAAACGEFKDMIVLERGLAHEFHTEAINITINNGSHMIVTFSNAPIADSAAGARAAFARRVGEFVRDHYPPYRQLATIDVAFVNARGGGGFTITSSQASYRFTPADLGASPVLSAPPAGEQKIIPVKN